LPAAFGTYAKSRAVAGRYDRPMGNPPTRGQRGPCTTCQAFGGPADQWGGVHCLRPDLSGKAVSKMPEAGCWSYEPMSRATWIDTFTRRGLELDDRLSGTDWDDIAVDVLGERQPGALDPRLAAEHYVEQTER
jgi:hypothetical protein